MNGFKSRVVASSTYIGRTPLERRDVTILLATLAFVSGGAFIANGGQWVNVDDCVALMRVSVVAWDYWGQEGCTFEPGPRNRSGAQIQSARVYISDA